MLQIRMCIIYRTIFNIYSRKPFHLLIRTSDLLRTISISVAPSSTAYSISWIRALMGVWPAGKPPATIELMGVWPVGKPTATIELMGIWPAGKPTATIELMGVWPTRKPTATIELMGVWPAGNFRRYSIFLNMGNIRKDNKHRKVFQISLSVDRILYNCLPLH